MFVIIPANICLNTQCKVVFLGHIYNTDTKPNSKIFRWLIAASLFKFQNCVFLLMFFFPLTFVPVKTSNERTQIYFIIKFWFEAGS